MKTRNSYVSNSSSSSFLVIAEGEDAFREILEDRPAETRDQFLLELLSADRDPEHVRKFFEQRMFQDLRGGLRNALMTEFPKIWPVIEKAEVRLTAGVAEDGHDALEKMPVSRPPKIPGHESLRLFADQLWRLSGAAMDCGSMAMFVDRLQAMALAKFRDIANSETPEGLSRLENPEECSRIVDWTEDRLREIARHPLVVGFCKSLLERFPVAGIVECCDYNDDAAAEMRLEIMPSLASENGNGKWIVLEN